MPKYTEDEYVCDECFNDEGLKEWVIAHAEANECSFCGRESDEPIGASISAVVEHIDVSVSQLYDDPANWLPYESAEGGYQGTTYTSQEILDEVGLDFPNDVDCRLRNVVADGLRNELWCDADPYALSPAEQLNFSWDRFCSVIKYKRRYFFTQEKRGKDNEIYSPSETLRVIFSYAEEAGAIVTLARGSRLFRVRRQEGGQRFTTAGELGPPPVECAFQTNRMSPPGIVMTYVSEDQQTALAETADSSGTYAIGEFVTERDALILDFTNLPSVPSIFTELSDTLEYDPRPRHIFLHHVSREISRPIARDDRAHVEYVLAQVVTEFVRTALTSEKGRVDGIRYRSSREGGSTSLVLFADQNNLLLEPEEQPESYSLWKDRWLRLTSAEIRVVSNGDIENWARTSLLW